MRRDVRATASQRQTFVRFPTKVHILSSSNTAGGDSSRRFFFDHHGQRTQPDGDFFWAHLAIVIRVTRAMLRCELRSSSSWSTYAGWAARVGAAGLNTA